MMSTGTACGKIILFGEHAVVYGRPALAIPLSQMRARASVEPGQAKGIVIRAQDLGREIWVEDTSLDDALVRITRLTLEALQIRGDLEITVASDIPLASGFGSGAAISTAIVRALADYFGRTLSADEVSMLVYETEKLYHGTPSGIDNTVIAYEQAIHFVRRPNGDREITPFQVDRPFTLLIANTGIPSPTKITVADVRRGWEQDPMRYEKIFYAVGGIVREAQSALANGENERLGELMRRNQAELEAMGVSSPEIERLLEAGLGAGAKGGKLSGGGRGGNVIFHVDDENAPRVQEAVLNAGAVSVIVTVAGGS